MTEFRKTIIEVPELQEALGLKGFMGKWITKRIFKMFELDKINALQGKLYMYSGPEYADKVLEGVGVKYDYIPEQLERIPAEGGFITVSNHHFGTIDGMILDALVGSRRPDFKILTTFMLNYIHNLRESFIPVDNLSKGGSRSITGIRTALNHIAGGGPLGLFPAGEVATWQKKKDRTAVMGKRVIEDKPWAENVIKLIKKSGFPVIPVYFDGCNSKSFHRLGLIHKRLRTVRLPHEMINKDGMVVKVRFGQPIMPAEIARFESTEALGKYLRSRCYALEAQCLPETEVKEHEWKVDVAPAVPEDSIREEMARLEAEGKVQFQSGDYKVFLLNVTDSPIVMQELYRLREVTFRAIGEGTGTPQDNDVYDTYYKQLILWNVPNREIVGAYRIGICKDIIENHGGLEGIYTVSLFQYRKDVEPLMNKCFELGRSFVVQKYQREVHPLRLLLAGLAFSSMMCPSADYAIGPVSISNDIPDFYKSLIVKFITNNYSIPAAERPASPTHPFVPNYLRVNPDDLMCGIAPGDIDAFDRMIGALSDGKYRIPVLVRKYFSCGARLACFNVDPLFSNSLDGLIFLPIHQFPENTMRSLLRGMPEEKQEAVLTHFYGEAAKS